MKGSHLYLLFATIVVLGCGIQNSTAAVEVTTDPVGFVSVTVPAQSDAVLAVPLYRTPFFRSRIQSISGSTITVTASPAWTNNQFVQGGSQTDTYAVLIISGDPETGKEGMIGQIIANGSRTLTVQLDEGDNFTGIKTEATNPSASDMIDIIPYWTPASLFPDLPSGIQILLFPTNQSGININSQVTLTKSVTAWSDGSANADNMPLFFGQGFVVRNQTTSSQIITMMGAVPMATHRHVMKKNSAEGTAQDIRIGYSSPVPEVIGNVHLGFTAGDQLLVFDNTAAGQNKSSVKTLVYNGAADWYDGATKVTNSFYLQPGQGYVFRRSPTVPAGKTTWKTLQSYLQP